MFKSKVKEISTLTKPDGDWVIQLTVPKGYHLNDLKESFDYVEIKHQPKKRSLTANGALWHLLDKMAAELKTSKDELYEQKIKEYGVMQYFAVKPEAVEDWKKQFRVVEVMPEHVNVNGKEAVQMKCYFGSSTYDSKQFARLLDGVIQDAKDLGIDFISSEERDLLIKEWGD